MVSNSEYEKATYRKVSAWMNKCQLVETVIVVPEMFKRTDKKSIK